MSAPKTLHLTNAFHPGSGGVRTVYRQLLAAGNALGRPVRLVVPGARHQVEDIGAHGRIYYVKAPRAFAIDPRYRLIMPSRYLLPGVQGLRQILRDEQPDIVEICDKHSLPYLAGLLRKALLPGVRRPTLVAASAERFDDGVSTFLSATRSGSAFACWFMRAIYAPMFDFHIANSTYTAQELHAALPPRRRHLLHIAPPALPAESFLPGSGSDACAALRAGSGPVRLITYVGRLSREKNLELLIATLERLIADETAGGVRYHAVIAGDGPMRAFLDAAAARLPGRLHLLGHLPGPASVRQLLASVDVFVHPNPQEPFGIAPLEAMAAGVPVVVPNCGGVLAYADDATAWLAAPTGDAFAASVRAVVAQPDVAAQRVEAARARAACFHEDLVMPRYFELLDRLHAERLNGQAAATPEAAGTGDTSTASR